ncbi:hypothetical protein GGS24DRAFT_470279 [Hypoxylon argillaceum]|nr:hypothetical protein GGS24DRAFT_470279 [Hypoxylon argillaceum]
MYPLFSLPSFFVCLFYHLHSCLHLVLPLNPSSSSSNFPSFGSFCLTLFTGEVSKIDPFATLSRISTFSTSPGQNFLHKSFMSSRTLKRSMIFSKFIVSLGGMETYIRRCPLAGTRTEQDMLNRIEYNMFLSS